MEVSSSAFCLWAKLYDCSIALLCQLRNRIIFERLMWAGNLFLSNAHARQNIINKGKDATLGFFYMTSQEGACHPKLINCESPKIGTKCSISGKRCHQSPGIALSFFISWLAHDASWGNGALQQILLQCFSQKNWEIDHKTKREKSYKRTVPILRW